MPITTPFYQICNPAIIDELIEKFVAQGWKFNEKSRNYFSKFHWPDIILSDEEVIVVDPITKKRYQNYDGDNLEQNKDYGVIELMGCYQPKGGNWNEEGQVILYYEKIAKVAEHFIQDQKALNTNQNLNKPLIIEQLSTIVLIHEFVHWIMHWIESPNGKIFIPFNYSTEDEVYFHEGFAQLLTRHVINTETKIEELFLWLEKGQPIQYLKYKELLNVDIEKYSGYSDLISIPAAIIILDVLRKNKDQSFETALSLIYKKRANIASNKFNF